MKLWKYHSETGTVTSIEGTPYPGTDADGETCYDNTHFKTEDEAWKHMVKDVMAGVSLAGMAVKSTRKALTAAEHEAGQACERYCNVMKNLPKPLQQMMWSEP